MFPLVFSEILNCCFCIMLLLRRTRHYISAELSMKSLWHVEQRITGFPNNDTCSCEPEWKNKIRQVPLNIFTELLNTLSKIHILHIILSFASCNPCTSEHNSEKVAWNKFFTIKKLFYLPRCIAKVACTMFSLKCELASAVCAQAFWLHIVVKQAYKIYFHNF